MRIFLTLLRRELSSFFYTWSGWVIIAAVALLTGLSFVVLSLTLGNDPITVPITEMFYGTYFLWLILLLISPVITMRLFAQEKASGTFETLMTAPVGDLPVVTAKFAAAMLFYLTVWLPLPGCLLIVRHFTGQNSALDLPTLGGMGLGILLVGGLFISLGCLASSLSRTQMSAAMISFVMGMSLFALGFLARIPGQADWAAQIFSSFNLFDQMHDFARGVVDTRAVTFYVSATFLFLFLTLRVVESRRWK